MDKVLATERARGEIQYVGVIDPRAIREMQRFGLEPATAAIAVRDHDVVHAQRRAKDSPLPPLLYRRLPELLQRAVALLHEKGSEPPALLYIVDLVREDGSAAKLVVKLDMAVKARTAGARSRVTANLLRTATVVDDARTLQDETTYRRLWSRVQP